MSEDQTDDQADDEKAAGADSPAPTTMTDVDKSGVEDATTSDVPPQQQLLKPTKDQGSKMIINQKHIAKNIPNVISSTTPSSLISISKSSPSNHHQTDDTTNTEGQSF